MKELVPRSQFLPPHTPLVIMFSGGFNRSLQVALQTPSLPPPPIPLLSHQHMQKSEGTHLKAQGSDEGKAAFHRSTPGEAHTSASFTGQTKTSREKGKSNRGRNPGVCSVTAALRTSEHTFFSKHTSLLLERTWLSQRLLRRNSVSEQTNC